MNQTNKFLRKKIENLHKKIPATKRGSQKRLITAQKFEGKINGSCDSVCKTTFNKKFNEIDNKIPDISH